MNNGFIVEDSMRNNKFYDGRTLKFGITIDGINYIIKLKETSPLSATFSEYIASRFIQSLGINCHDTWFGYYNGRVVVIMRDFTQNTAPLASYQDTEQSSEDTSINTKEYTYEDVLYMIKKHTKMSNQAKNMALRQFWQMFICDAILGNRDRHAGNWGYLKFNSGYLPAPIYDNGGSLFPNFDSKINEYVGSIRNGKEFEFIKDRAEKFPASLFCIKKDGVIKRTNFYEMFGYTYKNKILKEEVLNIINNYGFSKIFYNIYSVVQEVADIIPAPYRRFYIAITCVRYLHIIERKSIEDAYSIVKGV